MRRGELSYNGGEENVTGGLVQVEMRVLHGLRWCQKKMSASHEFFDHTSELGLRVRASSFAELLAEAARGLGKLMLRGRPASSTGRWRVLEVNATDREALLVDWLNELIFHAEVERWIAVEIEIVAASDTMLSARARGVAVDEAPALVKAATHHGLSVRQVGGGGGGGGDVEAEVVLDV